jgi:uncharacterized protein
METQARREHTVAGSEIDLVVERDGVRLAGSLWIPEPAEPSAVVLMHPGSGPSDRHNDVYFPPIREHLLGLGVAVCSFDKRGVGASTGDRLTIGIDEQAADALACAEHVSTVLPDVPTGFFGHSQGGWVVVEAAARRPGTAFVIVNSGPGVTPGAQERYATAQRLAEQARDNQEFADAARCFELALTCMSHGLPFGDVAAYVERAGLMHVYERPELFSIPIDDADIWPLLSLIIDHDPVSALRSLRAQTLALFGAADSMVPVDASVVAFESCVRADLLTVAVIEGGDHRVQRDSRFADGYFDAIDAFIDDALNG